MSLDIAMGGSTNTVLHLLAAAHEAGVAFTMDDIDRLSRRVPCLCKVAPPRPTCIWKMSTGPVESWPSWASWTELSVECRRADRTQRHLARGTAALGHMSDP